MNHKKKRCAQLVFLTAFLAGCLSFSVFAEESFSYYSSGGTGTRTAVGPGSAVMNIIDDTASAASGPKVETANLSESYYDEFECYSESINGAACIYSNVGNNSITDQSVYVDIPANVSYRLEKDGVVVPYASKALLSEHGSYRFQLTVVKDPDVPVSEQTFYKAVFNFRIADRTKPAAEKNSSYQGSSYYTFPAQAYQQPAVPETYEAVTEPAEEEETLPETEAPVLTFEEEPETEPAEQVVVIGEPETDLSFDLFTGFYRKEFEDGSVFLANVASGMPVNYAVETDVTGLTGGKKGIRVFCDGEETAYPEDGLFTDPGDYELQIPTENGSYHYRFSIFSRPVKGPVSLLFPEGTQMDSVTRDGEQEGFLTDSDGRVHAELSEEGTWVLGFTDANQQGYETTIIVDRTPPAVTAEKSGKVIVLSYENVEEIDHVTVRVNGRESEETILYEVKEPGEYHASFYDQAGNETELQFTLRKSVNAASVIAILLMIGILATAVFFFWRVRNKAVIK